MTDREIINKYAYLVEKWENIARHKFYDASKDKDPMGKRFLENGAMCYFNCAQQLKEVQALISLHPSTTQEECPK